MNTDIIKMETNIVLTDKDGNIIKLETPSKIFNGSF